MAQMTPTQRNYAVTRIRNITSNMVAATSPRFVLEKRKDVTIGELVSLILAGKIKPKQENSGKLYGNGYNGTCDNLDEAFEIVDPSSYFRTHPVYDEKKMSAVIQAVKTKSIQICDKLMLSDVATALKLVEDFEKEAADLDVVDAET